MGFSKSLLLEQESRNEAKEAIKLIEKVQVELVNDRFDLAEQLEDALMLIQKFINKHQPEIQRCK